MANQVNTQMRDAFSNAKVSKAIIGSPLVNSVINALSSKAGVRSLGRGWTANVSRRTLGKLMADGVFA